MMAERHRSLFPHVCSVAGNTVETANHDVSIPTSMYVRVMETRRRILVHNFEAMHRHGFQGMRADKTIADLGITKGALYHYFPTKADLGYAVVDEVLAPMFLDSWNAVTTCDGDPILCIRRLFTSMLTFCKDEDIALGCPLNNLMQEMSPLDEGFRTRLQNILTSMQDIVATALKRGQKEGYLRRDMPVARLAVFVVAGVEGGWGLAKVHKDKAILKQTLDTIIAHLETFRA